MDANRRKSPADGRRQAQTHRPKLACANFLARPSGLVSAPKVWPLRPASLVGPNPLARSPACSLALLARSHSQAPPPACATLFVARKHADQNKTGAPMRAADLLAAAGTKRCRFGCCCCFASTGEESVAPAPDCHCRRPQIGMSRCLSRLTGADCGAPVGNLSHLRGNLHPLGLEAPRDRFAARPLLIAPAERAPVMMMKWPTGTRSCANYELDLYSDQFNSPALSLTLALTLAPRRRRRRWARKLFPKSMAPGKGQI